MTPNRIVVIGAGPMGRLHARAIARRAARHGDCELVGIVDRNVTRSEEVAGEFGGRAFESLHSVRAEAAVVAVPTRSHGSVTREALELGMDVLVEKPMCASLTEAKELAELARNRGCLLAVGHVEWFNAALQAGVKRAGVPHRIEVDRFNSENERGLDIDVVQDFMLHDIDWVSRVVGSEIIRIDASGRQVVTELLDEAQAELHFASGCAARLRASRVHAKRVRHVRIEGALETVEVDLLEMGENRNRTRLVDGVDASDPTTEPLDAEWADFLDACRERRAPQNDAAVGLATLEIVERVRKRILEPAGELRLENDSRLRG